MFSTADKFNIFTGFVILFSVFVIGIVAVSFYKKRKLSLVLKAALLFVLFGTLSIADMYWIEPNWIETEEVVVHDAALAEVLAGLTVVQISDIHIWDQIGYRERALIEKVNALKPDLLFITGDFFSDRKPKDRAGEVAAITELIRSFKVKVGIFGIPGNYDQPLLYPGVIGKMKDSGIDILFSASRIVSLPNNKLLYLVGFDDAGNKRGRLKAYSEVPADTPVILLSHHPDILGEASRLGANLVLSGHTHGGQIGIPFLIRMSNSANKSPYMSGLFSAGRTKMYVNRGIGTTHIPVRFFCRPEITVIKVKA